MKLKGKKPVTLFLTGYAPLLANLKARVRAAQVKAAVAVNRELILLYWHIGREILRAQKAEGWGTKVVERLAKDLAAEFPEMGGFSAQNLKRMRAFYGAWAPVEIVPQAVAQLNAPIVSQPVRQLQKGAGKRAAEPIVSQAVRQLDEPPEPLTLLTWSANLILIEQLKDPATPVVCAQGAGARVEPGGADGADRVATARAQREGHHELRAHAAAGTVGHGAGGFEGSLHVRLSHARRGGS
jgi:hypothetical protein